MTKDPKLHPGACTCPACLPDLWAAGIKGSKPPGEMINSEWYRGCRLPSGHEGECSASLAPQEQHPLNDEHGFRHSSRCARWFTPAFEVVRRACDCGVENGDGDV
jgi:hypothetical protein